MLLTACAVARAAGPASTSAPASQPKAYVAVFDFATVGEGDWGKQLADSVRLRLARHKELEVIDGLTIAGASGPAGVQTPRDRLLALMTKALGANVAFYGTVSREGARTVARVACLDLRMPGEPVEWTREISRDGERARGLIAQELVEAFTGQLEWKPPEYGDEPEPRNFGKPLNVNGSFEAAGGWERPDGVSQLLVKEEGRGTVLRINTALQRDPWLEYKRKLLLGQASPDNPPKIARDTSYGSVAGLEGVHFKSEWIKASPGIRYWLTADCKGPGGAKVFVKGFRSYAREEDSISESALAQLKMTPQQFAALDESQRRKLIEADAKANPMRYLRECYRWYLNCGKSDNKWTHFAAPVPPRGGLPDNVEWIQLQVYSYWPPGDYYWDNVNLFADPNQKAPLTEEARRTPNFATERASQPTSNPK
jgi:hypothetical protein